MSAARPATGAAALLSGLASTGPPAPSAGDVAASSTRLPSPQPGNGGSTQASGFLASLAARPDADAAAPGRPSVSEAASNVSARPSAGRASAFLSSLSAGAAAGVPAPSRALPATEPRSPVARDAAGKAGSFLSSLGSPSHVPPSPPIGRTAATAQALGSNAPLGITTQPASAAAFLSTPAPLQAQLPAPPPPIAANFLGSALAPRPPAPVARLVSKPTRAPESIWELSYRTLCGGGGSGVAAAADGRETTGYCLAPINVEGSGLPLRLEKIVAQERAAGREVDISHRLLVSFFDCEAGAFFGSTWESPPEPIPSTSSPSPIDHDRDVYFHSPLATDRYILVIETCYTLRYPYDTRPAAHAGAGGGAASGGGCSGSGGGSGFGSGLGSGGVSANPAASLPAHEVSAGWTFLRPFSSSLDDTASGRQETQLLASLFAGSPLALLHATGGNRGAGAGGGGPGNQRGSSGAAGAGNGSGSASAGLESLLRPTSAKLRYSLRTHRGLAPALPLLAPHRGYSPCDPVPGLIPGGRDAQTGELELCGLSSPKPQGTIQAETGAAHVLIPDGLEARVRRAVYNTAGVGAAAPDAGGGSTAITARRQAATATAAAAAVRLVGWRLILGVHTGHSQPGRSAELILSPDGGGHSEFGAPAAGQGVVRLSSPAGAAAVLTGLAMTKRHAIVAELHADYELNVDGVNVDGLNLDAAGLNRDGAGGSGPRRVSALVCWGVLLPFDGSHLQTGRLSLSLRFGADGRPAPLTGARAPGGGAPLAACLAGPENKSIGADKSDPTETRTRPPALEMELHATGWKDLVSEIALGDAAEIESAAAAAEAALEARMPPRMEEAEAEFVVGVAVAAEARGGMRGDARGGDGWDYPTEGTPAHSHLPSVPPRGISGSSYPPDLPPEQARAQLCRALAFYSGNMLRSAFAGWSHVASLTRRGRGSVPVRILLHSFSILGSIRAPPNSLLRLEISSPLSIHPLRLSPFKRSTQSVRLDYEEDVDVLQGSRPAAALAAAASAPSGTPGPAASVQILLYALPADTGGGGSMSGMGPMLLGHGELSLPAMLAAGADVERETLPLFSPMGEELAEVIISLQAVEAMRTLTSSVPAAGANAVDTRRRAPAGGALVSYHAESYSGRDGGQYRGGGRQLRDSGVGTDQYRGGEDEYRGGGRPRSKAEAYMELMRGEGLARSIADLLSEMGPPPPHQSTRMARADKAALWEASRRLADDTGGEGRVGAWGGGGAAEEDWDPDATHNVLIQFISYTPASPLVPAAPPPASLLLSFQFYTFEPRTTPRALLQPADLAAAAPPGGIGQVRVEVSSLRVGGALAREPSLGELWVEQALPSGIASGAPAPPTKRVRKAAGGGGGGRLPLGYTHTFDLSGREPALAAALRSKIESDACVRFTLKAVHGRGERVVGEGAFSFHSLLRDGADATGVEVVLHGQLGDVGSLGVSIYALATVRAAMAGASQGTASAFLDSLKPADASVAPSGISDPPSGISSDLVLIPADPSLASEGPGLVERFLLQPPAEGTDGNADWEEHAQRQASRFRGYLRDRAIYVDVWDGASLLQIGTARVPLSALLRRATEKTGQAFTVKEYLTVDVIETPLTHIDSAPSADPSALTPPVAKGQLKLVIARLTAATRRSAAGGARADFHTAGRGEGDRQVERYRRGGGHGGHSRGVDGGRCKVRLRPIPPGSANRAHSRLSITAAEEAALYQKQIRRQRHREWLRTHGAVLGVEPSAAFAAAFGGGGAVSAGAVGGGYPGGGKWAGAHPLSRSMELGMDREAMMAKARLQMAMRGLRTAEQARAASKDSRLRSLLSDSVQAVRYLYPSYGSAELVELPFRNPYASEHCFTVAWEDAMCQLTIVTDLGEWRALKARAGLNTPAEDRLVLQGHRLWLMPQELVYIPFKFQAWQHGAVRPGATHAPPTAAHTAGGAAGGGGSTGGGAADPIPRRAIAVSVLNVQREQVASLDLRIRPQPYAIDQTFRFHQPELEYLKTTIRVDPSRWAGPKHNASQQYNAASAPVGGGGPPPGLPPAGPPPLGTSWSGGHPPAPLPVSSLPGLHPEVDRPPVYIRCSDPDVVAGVHERSHPAAPVNVSLKYRCGASPAVGRFLVLVFEDVYMHALREIWEVIVHSLRRIDMHALVGQTSNASIHVSPPDQQAAHGLSQAFSSCPSELAISPSGPFALHAGQPQELKLALRPLTPGRRQYVIHVVELRTHALLASYLVAAVNRLPAVTKSFSLSVPATLGANRKVSLANPYSYGMSFTVRTDCPHLISFKTDKLAVPAGETRYIGLRFAPHAPGTPVAATARVFVNNADDKNEECMEIAVIYTATGQADASVSLHESRS